MAEFLVILPVMLILIFGAIQFALIFHAKITLNYATFEAARYGSLGGGRFSEAKEGFARGLAPLYSYFESDKSIRDKRAQGGQAVAGDQIQAFQMARDRLFNEFDSPNSLIRIERLNPTDASYQDFAPDEKIPNDNLMFRSSKVEQKSKSNIQDANLLHLRVTYWYPLYVPFINNVIFNGIICCKGENPLLKNCKWKQDPVCTDENQEPVIPLTATSVMRMQSAVENSIGYFEQGDI